MPQHRTQGLVNSFQAEEASLAVAKREAMSDLKIFHWTGALEAISYLLLFFVAMPLKYLWQMPIFVRWVGLFHGIFFILFCLAAVWVGARRGWPVRVIVLALVSSLFPFGPFVFEKKVLTYYA